MSVEDFGVNVGPASLPPSINDEFISPADLKKLLEKSMKLFREHKVAQHLTNTCFPSVLRQFCVGTKNSPCFSRFEEFYVAKRRRPRASPSAFKWRRILVFNVLLEYWFSKTVSCLMKELNLLGHHLNNKHRNAEQKPQTLFVWKHDTWHAVLRKQILIFITRARKSRTTFLCLHLIIESTMWSKPPDKHTR